MRMSVNWGKSTPLLDRELKASNPTIKMDEMDKKIGNNLNAPICHNKTRNKLNKPQNNLLRNDISISGILLNYKNW